MKIKGVKGGRRHRGDVVEYDPAEKVLLAVKDAVKAKNTKDLVYWADDIIVESHSHQAKSPKDLKGGNKRFANNVYLAKGEVTVRPCNATTNKLRPKMKGKFNIQFEDTQDNVGMPDLKINKIKFEGLMFKEA